MPPWSLIILKYAASALPIVPYADAGPLYVIVWPILISVSDAPGSYFFCPSAGPTATADKRTVTNHARMPFILSPPYGSKFVTYLPCRAIETDCASAPVLVHSDAEPPQLVVQRLAGDAERRGRRRVIALLSPELLDDQHALVVFQLLRQAAREAA